MCVSPNILHAAVYSKYSWSDDAKYRIRGKIRILSTTGWTLRHSGQNRIRERLWTKRPRRMHRPRADREHGNEYTIMVVVGHVALEAWGGSPISKEQTAVA